MQKRWIIISAVNLHLDDDGDLVRFASIRPNFLNGLSVKTMVKSKFELNVHLHWPPNANASAPYHTVFYQFDFSLYAIDL